MKHCKCGSYAINPHTNGRLPGVDLHLCDVCYWRVRAEARPGAVEALTDDQWYAAVCAAEHLCPLDLPHLEKQRWKARHIRAALKEQR